MLIVEVKLHYHDLKLDKSKNDVEYKIIEIFQEKWQILNNEPHQHVPYCAIEIK